MWWHSHYSEMLAQILAFFNWGKSYWDVALRLCPHFFFFALHLTVWSEHQELKRCCMQTPSKHKTEYIWTAWRFPHVTWTLWRFQGRRGASGVEADYKTSTLQHVTTIVSDRPSSYFFSQHHMYASGSNFLPTWIVTIKKTPDGMYQIGNMPYVTCFQRIECDG